MRTSRTPRRAMAAFEFEMAKRDMRPAARSEAAKKAWKNRQIEKAIADADKRRLSLSKKGW